MAFFTESVLDDGIVLENKEMYANEYGMDAIMMECAEFDKETFSDLVVADFREMAMIHEGASEEAIQEGVIETLKKVGKKIVEFVKKWYAKIKAFVSNMVSKILGRFTSDNKKVYEKYKDKVKENKDAASTEIKWVKDCKKCFTTIDCGVTTAEVEKMVGQATTGKVEFADLREVKTAVKNLMGLKDQDGDITTNSVIKHFIGEEIDSTFGKEQADIERTLQNGDAVMKAIQTTGGTAQSLIKTSEGLFKNPKENESKRYTMYRQAVMQLTAAVNTLIKGQIAAAQLVLRLARTAYIKAAK